MQYQEVLRFWFEEIDNQLWFKKDTVFDQLLRQRFAPWLTAAAKGELFHWREQIEGRLAEIIILDQFSRNMFRDDQRAFANDGMALVLAQEALRTNQSAQLEPVQRSFLYLPFMHAESALIHQLAVPLFETLEMASSLDYELRHKQIIDRFGRFPHRNKVLGRASTAEELEFLQQPGSSF